MRWISRHFVALIVASLALPALIAFVLTGSLAAAAIAYFWAGLVRVFFVHHITWSVNSVCHFLGSRRFQTDDESTNVFWLALPSLGESWHHNHHAFPRSARHGLRWWEIDVSGLAIAALARLGLVHNVVTITPERQEQRRHGAVVQSRRRQPDGQLRVR